MGYSYQATARYLLYAHPHEQVSTYHSICYTVQKADVLLQSCISLLTNQITPFTECLDASQMSNRYHLYNKHYHTHMGILLLRERG